MQKACTGHLQWTNVRVIIMKTIMANAGARTVAIPDASGSALSSDAKKGK